MTARKRSSSVISVLGLALAFVTAGVFSASCASVQKVSSTETADLTWNEAKERKARLQNVSYDLDVDLRAQDFSGAMKIQFDHIGEPNADLRLDFFEGNVTRLHLNGRDLALSQKKKYLILLPKDALKSGGNTLEVSYVQKYSTSGEGLHRFQDPVDRREYLYTQFETYDANKFMPCFDQPDLRAVLKMKVLAPAKWIVVTAAPERSVKVEKDRKRWEFEPTASISTYLFALHAGEYAVFKDTYRRADGSKVPLRIMVRESLKKYLKHKDWFLTSKQGLAFFENYFAQKYPFIKLDQLVVPEFNAGGMENVGAITYSEWALPRAPQTRQTQAWVANLHLHEIAHMWFGDLVTMKWWNDLWLNESFATYMAALATSEATEFKEAWQYFAAFTKSRAYAEDTMSTTHPIEASVANVKEAFTNFDGITYNKGASVVKQLAYHMTSQDFREGIREYFRAHAFGNTELKDFIGALQKHTKKDLTLWSERWLRQSGADQVSVSWTCDEDRLREFTARLETPFGVQPRPQSLEIGFFKYAPAAKKALSQNRERVDFSGLKATEDITVRGDWSCPDFVYPNHGDHGYALVKLDSKSLDFLKTRLVEVEDPMIRALVWSDLWRMVRETQISLKTYIEVLDGNFASEKDDVVLTQVLGTISRSGSSVLGYWPLTPMASKDERTRFVAKMEAQFLKRIETAVSGSDQEKFWLDGFVDLAESPQGIDRLHGWIVRGRVSKNFELDLDRQWKIANQLSRYQHPKADLVLASLRKKDTSDRGLKSALAAEAVKPDLGSKKRWVSEFAGATPTSRSLEESRSVLGSLFPVEQKDLKLGFTQDFYRYLETHRNSEDYLRVAVVLRSLSPLSCEKEQSARLKTTVQDFSDMNPIFKKHFLMSLEEDERCQRIRSVSHL